MMRQRGMRLAQACLRWRRLPLASAWRASLRSWRLPRPSAWRCRLAVATAVLIGSAGTAFAQLDPLLFMRGSGDTATVDRKANVLLVVDTANRMQRDGNDVTDYYYDQNVYTRTGALWEAALGITGANTARNYRRRYLNLRHLDTSLTADKFEANHIEIIGDLQPGYATFDARTRMAVARQALLRAIQLNSGFARFGLIKMRQSSVALGAPSNEGPVKNDDPNQYTPTDLSLGKWHITRPTVTVPNSFLTDVVAPVCKPDAGTCGSGSDAAAPNDYIRGLLAKSPDLGGLIPAGQDSAINVDAPVKFMLDDARSEAARLIAADTVARNTVVVLVVGGGEGNTSGGADPTAAASSFKSIGSRRVPIYVIAIVPAPAVVDQLKAIAANSGGQYVEITKAMINAVAPGAPVPEVVRALNNAVQHTLASFSDFNTAPTVQLPYGPSTEYQVTSPIIGTVNLDNAVDIAGNALPNTVIAEKNGNVIPQRSNVMITTGVAVPGDVNTPGFPGRLRAFRVYRPVADNTKTSGYKFVGDGTALWLARAPLSGEGARNIYTALPDGTMVPFTSGNWATLAPYLQDVNPAQLIDYIRSLPLGAFIDSTPAFLDAPSLDPPPDTDYPGFVAACKKRRTLIFVGGNDGMLHAIDGRTGVEVWAFIPTNLLSKLRALREGQPIDAYRPGDTRLYPDGKSRSADGFRFFADGSPKLADVKVGGQWRTYMVFGEGPGGTFYQTMDVTMADLGTTIAPDSDNVSGLLSYFSRATSIPFKWSFPSYAHFNFTWNTNAAQYGDLDKDAATAIEKSVGQTWSDPAVGQVRSSSGSWVTLVGSGFLPYSQQIQANRAGTSGGTTFYVLDMATGTVLDSRNVGNDGTAENIDNCAISADVTKSGAGAAPNCTKQKNALQSDPVATGPPNSRFVDTVYLADLDGRLWRFTLGLTASNAATISTGPVKLFDAGDSQPLYSSMAVVNFGGTQQYIFLGSGSDLLSSVGVSQSYKVYSVLDQSGSGMQKFAVSLAAVDGAGGDEKVSAYPAVAGDIVFFTTTTFKPGTPRTIQPDANVYAFTFIGGPAYDNTGDDKVDSHDTPKVKTLVGAGRATAPFVSDQHLVLAAGGNIQMFGDPEDFNNGVGQVGVRILSWREIR